MLDVEVVGRAGLDYDGLIDDGFKYDADEESILSVGLRIRKRDLESSTGLGGVSYFGSVVEEVFELALCLNYIGEGFIDYVEGVRAGTDGDVDSLGIAGTTSASGAILLGFCFSCIFCKDAV
jgi:hypothetical protein